MPDKEVNKINQPVVDLGRCTISGGRNPNRKPRDRPPVIFIITSASKEKKLLGDVRLGSQIRSTPAVSDGVLYVASQHYLWAVQKDPKNPDLKGKVLASGDSKTGQ